MRAIESARGSRRPEVAAPAAPPKGKESARVVGRAIPVEDAGGRPGHEPLKARLVRRIDTRAQIGRLTRARVLLRVRTCACTQMYTFRMFGERGSLKPKILDYGTNAVIFCKMEPFKLAQPFVYQLLNVIINSLPKKLGLYSFNVTSGKIITQVQIQILLLPILIQNSC